MVVLTELPVIRNCLVDLLRVQTSYMVHNQLSAIIDTKIDITIYIRIGFDIYGIRLIQFCLAVFNLILP